MINHCKTNYSELYHYTYWGNFEPNGNDTFSQSIYDNRNSFPKDFNIDQHLRSPPNYINNIISNDREKGINIDHMEVYRSNQNKNNVVIISPYGDPDQSLYFKHGWKMIDNLYSDGAITFVKIIPMKIKNIYRH